MPHKREKVLFVITKSNWGGAQKYVFDLATSLKDEYDVVVSLGGDGRLKDMLLARGIEVRTIPSLTRDISWKRELRAFFDTWSIIRDERPDILHLNSSKAGGLGALAGRLARVKKIVFTAHAWAWNEERPPVQRVLIAPLHVATVMLAHRTICVSNAVFDQMARFPFTRKKMRVVHLGITPAPRIERAHARTYLAEHAPALRGTESERWIATVGELHPIKGHVYALRAFKDIVRDFPDVHYCIIGEGSTRRALEAETERLGLKMRVHFLGHIDDIATLMPAFDLMLVPSLSEAFGYVVVESGAAGVATVASAVGGIPEIMTEGTGVLVPKAQSDAIAHAVKALLNDEKGRAAMAAALEHRVRTYFTRERMTEETKTVYALIGS